METLRVALIGKTGPGKIALANTLLGRKVVESNAGAEGVTYKCEIATGMLPSGKQIKVVDPPDIMNTKGTDVNDEIAKAIAALSPGPHAIIVVLQAVSDTANEKNVIKQLTQLFGDEGFLEHTLIVTTKSADIVDVRVHSMTIQSLIGKRNYAMEVTNAISKIVGYFSHSCFDMSVDSKLQAKNTAMIKSALMTINVDITINCGIL